MYHYCKTSIVSLFINSTETNKNTISHKSISIGKAITFFFNWNFLLKIRIKWQWSICSVRHRESIVEKKKLFTGKVENFLETKYKYLFTLASCYIRDCTDSLHVCCSFFVISFSILSVKKNKKMFIYERVLSYKSSCVWIVDAVWIERIKLYMCWNSRWVKLIALG